MTLTVDNEMTLTAVIGNKLNSRADFGFVSTCRIDYIYMHTYIFINIHTYIHTYLYINIYDIISVEEIKLTVENIRLESRVLT